MSIFSVRLTKKYPCPTCGRKYTHLQSVAQHLRYECGKDPQFKCPQCDYKAKQKCNLKAHLARKHFKILP